MQLLIDGKFVDAKSGKTFGTEDPRTGAQLIEIAEAQAEDVDAAVKAARKVTFRQPTSPLEAKLYNPKMILSYIIRCCH